VPLRCRDGRSRCSESHVPVRAAPLLGEHTEAVWSDGLRHIIKIPNGESKSWGIAGARIPHGGRAGWRRVVDFTQLEAGTSILLISALAMKVEEPKRGERRPTQHREPGIDAITLLCSMHKRSLLQYQSERDKELFEKLSRRLCCGRKHGSRCY